MMSKEFWKEAKKRRNLFFVWWLCWIPFGVLFIALEQAIWEQESPLHFSTPLIVWGVPWYYIAYRIRKLKCPKCHERAFDHCLFFMKNAKCQSCGYTYQ